MSKIILISHICLIFKNLLKIIQNFYGLKFKLLEREVIQESLEMIIYKEEI